jgi:HPt (histidine-containing phosphotransfer) domain-containing protein
LDRSAVLERVGGDEALLREIAGIFLTEYPGFVSQIREAIDSRDPQKLERSAHSLKGAVSNFGAHTATQAAYQLEVIGRSARLHEAPEALLHLEGRLAELRPALLQLAET